jgi:hypothetical protein
MRTAYALTVLFCCLPLPLIGAGSEPDPVAQDEAELRSARVGTDGPALLEFLRQRAGTDAGRARARELVKQLADDSFERREKASEELVKLGRVALPALREAAKDRDPEVSRRAAECLRGIESDAGRLLASAALRLLAVRKPAGAAAVLLDYLPVAEDEGVADDIRAALAALAVKDGKADPALVKALADESALKRATAAEALARAGAKDQRDALVKLLKDQDAGVRQRVALGLLGMKEREAVPVLIDLLGRLPAERGWETEDVLGRLAGEEAPSRPRESTDKALGEWRQAWHGWWKKHADTADLAAAARAPRFLGYTLVVLLDKGQVFETDRDGKTRWEIGGLSGPLDARVLPGDRVLIVESGTQQVTERNLKGEVLWSHKAVTPVAAQRLPNGNTFIATAGRLVEVRRDNSEVSSITLPGASITTAQKLPDGRIFCVTGQHRCLLLDAAGKELRGFDVPAGVQTTSSLSFEGLPAGHVLLVDYGGGAVRQYDAAGKVVWEAAVSRPISAWRLPGGNTVVSSQDNVLVELDRAGKEVKQDKIDGHPTRVRKR